MSSFRIIALSVFHQKTGLTLSHSHFEKIRNISELPRAIFKGPFHFEFPQQPNCARGQIVNCFTLRFILVYTFYSAKTYVISYLFFCLVNLARKEALIREQNGYEKSEKTCENI